MGNYSKKIASHRYPLWKETGPSLKWLDIELTERCNNDCIHCCINLPADDAQAQKKELSTAEIKKILTEATALGCLTVRLTGGEPLLREDFSELYLFSRRLGLKVMLFTNATLLTPTLVQLFKRIPPLEEIGVSLYGMKAQSYEAVSRTPGSFELAWQGIRLLLDNGVPFSVKSAFLPPLKGERKEFEAWAATIPWMDKAPMYSTLFDLRCRRDSEKKNRSIRKLRPTRKETSSFLAEELDGYIAEWKGLAPQLLATQGDRLFSCGAGAGVCSLDAYGFFQPCLLCRHPDTVFDSREWSLAAVMKECFPRIRRFKAANPDYLKRCAVCFLKGLCLQCPGRSWPEHGTLDTPVDDICDLAQMQARFLGLIHKDEKPWEIKDWHKRIADFGLSPDKSPEMGSSKSNGNSAKG